MIRDFLVDLVNHRFFITFSISVIVIGGALLFRGGVDPAKAGILLAIAAACLVVWRVLVTHNTAGITDLKSVQEALRNGDRPTLVEFYSPYCAGCLAMKPIVDQLEVEAGARLQIVRLNIDTEPGRSLVESYGVLFTPTFVYFDRNGNKIRDSVLVLDRARILYDLDQAQSSGRVA